MNSLAHTRTWDYALTVVTVILLATLGLQSLLGTFYAWWALSTIPNWEAFGYYDFVYVMNLIAAPQVVALVVVMGLCVPKRLLDQTALIIVSGVMLAIGLVAWAVTGSMQDGLATYLALAGLIQVAVVALTIAGTRGPSYMTEGRLVKTGSGLLHLGFIAFAYVVVALQNSAFMLPAFWVATLLTVVGTLMSFYADKLAFKTRVRVEVDRPLAEE